MLGKFGEAYRMMGQPPLDHDCLYDTYRTLYKTQPPRQKDLAGIIGTVFQLDSRNMIFTSHVMSNSGVIVPKNRVLGSADSLTDYWKVAGTISFIDYFDELLCPYFQSRNPGLTKEALIESTSLRSIESYLRNTPKIVLMDNEDELPEWPHMQYQPIFGRNHRLVGVRETCVIVESPGARTLKRLTPAVLHRPLPDPEPSPATRSVAWIIRDTGKVGRHFTRALLGIIKTHLEAEQVALDADNLDLINRHAQEALQEFMSRTP